VGPACGEEAGLIIVVSVGGGDCRLATGVATLPSKEDGTARRGRLRLPLRISAGRGVCRDANHRRIVFIRP